MQSDPSVNEKVYIKPKEKPVYDFFKRFFDLFFSLLAFIPFCLIWLGVAIAIKCEDGGPVMYKSIRLTKDGREFYTQQHQYHCQDRRPADRSLEGIEHRVPLLGCSATSRSCACLTGIEQRHADGDTDGIDHDGDNSHNKTRSGSATIDGLEHGKAEEADGG